MKLLLDALCDLEDNGGVDSPNYFRVELADHDIERIRQIVALLEENAKGATHLFSAVRVGWLDGQWFENLPEDFKECAWLTDEEPDENADTDEECYHGMRGLECTVNAKNISFSGYYKHGAIPYSAWSIDVQDLLRAYDMKVEDAPKHINSDDHYMKARAKELLGGS